MNKLLSIIVIFSFTLIYGQDAVPPTPVTAPPADPAPVDAFFKKLGENISLRKTFEASSKDEAKPATFFWINDSENSYRYFTADVGLKTKEIDLFKKAKYLISPKFEWHRDDIPLPDKSKDNISGGIMVDIMPFALPVRGMRPYLTGSLDWKNDYIKELETFNSKIYVSAIGSGNGFPHVPMRVSEHTFFEYQLYSGYEYYENIDKARLHSSNWTNRIFVDIRPIPPLSTYVQIIADFAHRTIISDNLYNKRDLGWFTAGLNIYFNELQNIGIGIDYSLGDDPASNFVDTEKVSFGIKLKV